MTDLSPGMRDGGMDEHVQRALFQAVDALCSAIETRDPRTAGHHRRVSALARRIAQALSLDKDAIEGVRVGAALHDVGKNGVPFEILSKPAILSAEEMAIVRSHVSIGTGILAHVEFPWPVLDIAGQHHERLDGTGYPAGLRGDEIRFESRIVAVADCVDAMLSNRPYRGARSLEYVADELARGRGRAYDADVVDACLPIVLHPEFMADIFSSTTSEGRLEPSAVQAVAQVCEDTVAGTTAPAPPAADVETVIVLRGGTQRYRVRAYRQLSKEEASKAVLDAVMSHRADRSSQGEEVVVQTNIGKPPDTPPPPEAAGGHPAAVVNR